MLHRQLMESHMTKRYEIFFEDECPRIGCGKRRVECNVGYKWVYIRTPFQPRRVRVARRVFDAMKPRELES
jgi:hypothetical protein